MSELRGTKALEFWCQRSTKGYDNVKIENMTTSWRDGLGFCALIHKFRPDLIDFHQLKKSDIYHNNDLAFTTAAKHLGIPPLLDAEDMVANDVPDRLSVLTYLSQFYHVFTHQKSENNSPLKYSRPKLENTEESKFVELPAKISHKVEGVRRDSCQKCQFPVFLAERVFIDKHVYHRTCLKCKRCAVQLSPNILFDEQQNMYCSDICLNDNNLHLSRNETETVQSTEDTDSPNEIREIEIVSKIRQPSNIEDEPSLEEEKLEESPSIPQDMELPISTSLDNTDAISNHSTESLPTIQESAAPLSNPETQSVEETETEQAKETPETIETIETPTLPEEENKPDEQEQTTSNNTLDLEAVMPVRQDDHSSTPSIEDIKLVSDKVEIETVKEKTYKDLNPFDDSDDDDDENTSDNNQQNISTDMNQSQTSIRSRPAKSYNPFDSSDDEIELAKPHSQPLHEHNTLTQSPTQSLNESYTKTMPQSTHKKHFKYNKRPAPAPPKPERLDASISKENIDKDKAALIGQGSKPVPAKRLLVPLDQSLLSPDNFELNSHTEQNQQSTYKDSDNYCRRMLMPPALDSPQFEFNPIAGQVFARRPENLENESNDNGEPYPDGSSAMYNKSSQAKWKHRKGPAPAIPCMTPRKVPQIIPLQEIRHELEIIEVQQQGLEKQGVVLERMIRDRCEGSARDVPTTGDLSSTLTAVTAEASTKNCKEVEDLILQLFELVNEKNELFRRQAELTHIRRQHRLEQEYADIESEIRILIGQPERNKTDSDKLREETLIARLVEIVELRNKVIECLENDRLREAQEDLSIKQSLELYNAGRDSSASKHSGEKLSKKEKRGVKDVHKLIKYKSLLRRSAKSE